MADDFIFFYNPLFDTVIQRRNYDALRYNIKDEVESKSLFTQYYTGILRWQILTVGNVLLTDAMWYDSIYFRILSDDELQSLIKFAESNRVDGIVPPLELRARKDHVKMFCKEFYFSSIDNRELRTKLVDVGNKLKESGVDNAVGGESDAVKAMKIYLERFKKEVEDNSVKFEGYKEFSKSLSCLAEGAQKITEFSYKDGNWPKLNALAENPIGIAFTELSENFKERYKDVGENSNLKKIEDELENLNRSVIEDILENMLATIESPIIEEFYEFFEKKYTCAIAKSQNAEYLDCRRVFEKALFSKEEGNPENIIHLAIEFLGKMSWEDFQNIYNENKTIHVELALQNSGKDYVLLNEIAGGREVDGKSLFDVIFFGKVIFSKLDSENRICVPQKFREKIYCEDGVELEYQDCVLFSNRDDSCVVAYFLEDFEDCKDHEAVRAAEFLMCPLSKHDES